MEFLGEALQRFWENLVERPSGPLALRFVLQPSVASILAIRDGIKDAQAGRSPYFWALLSNPLERKKRLREGLAATGKVIILALILDSAFQIWQFGMFYPGEAIVIALALGFIPYLIIRGPAERVARLSGVGS